MPNYDMKNKNLYFSEEVNIWSCSVIYENK